MIRALLIALALASSPAFAQGYDALGAALGGAPGVSAGQDIATLGCVFTAPNILDCPSGSAYILNVTNSGAGSMALHVDGNLVFHAGNDGAGSQLDADFLDALSSAAFCQVSGGANCILTSAQLASAATLQLNGGSFTILDSAGGADLIISALTGSTGFSAFSSSDTSGSALFLSTNAGATSIGQRQNQSANGPVVVFGDQMDPSSGSVTALARVMGGGFYQTVLSQSAACAAGVLALDPTSSVVYIDGNSAACAVTLDDATLETAGPGIDIVFVITGTPGAGVVTFPDVTNEHNGPLCATTTGLGLGDTYKVHFANMANDQMVGMACSDN